jgi:hypothetical protein
MQAQIILRRGEVVLPLKILQKELMYKKAKNKLLQHKTVGVPCDKSSSAKIISKLREKFPSIFYSLFKIRL